MRIGRSVLAVSASFVVVVASAAVVFAAAPAEVDLVTGTFHLAPTAAPAASLCPDPSPYVKQVTSLAGTSTDTTSGSELFTLTSAAVTGTTTTLANTVTGAAIFTGKANFKIDATHKVTGSVNGVAQIYDAGSDAVGRGMFIGTYFVFNKATKAFQAKGKVFENVEFTVTGATGAVDGTFGGNASGGAIGVGGKPNLSAEFQGTC